jgi:hypothetical protein
MLYCEQASKQLKQAISAYKDVVRTRIVPFWPEIIAVGMDRPKVGG